jgi:hypothetical protein
MLKPIDVDYEVVRSRRTAPRISFDDALRLAEIVIGAGLFCLAAWGFHEFMSRNF